MVVPLDCVKSPVARRALDATDRALIAELQEGLPIVSRPYALIAERLGMTEANVMARIRSLMANGIFKRFGVIVRHHELGYCANAMVVWDVPDAMVAQVGHALASHPEVRLCYRRPRRPPEWPYNLFCMIHGRDRDEVLAVLHRLVERLALHGYRHDVLFSTRRFKQRGANYGFAGQRRVAGGEAYG